MARLNALENRVSRLEQEIGYVGKRTEKIEGKLDSASDRLARIEERMSHLPTAAQAARLEERIARLPSTSVLLTTLGLLTTVLIAVLANIPRIIAFVERMTAR